MKADMRPIPLTLIVAATPSNAIGRSSSLPWRLSKEMAYFARVTKGEDPSQQGKKNAVIMGRKSWEGIPSKFRPLQDRINVVVSRQEGYDLGNSPQTHLASSLEQAVGLLQSDSTTLNRTFLIGGAQLYNQSLSSSTSSSSSSQLPYLVNRVLLTRLLTEYEGCDTFLHPFTEDSAWKRASHEELRDWAGWDVPEGVQSEKDRMVKDHEKIVEYEFQMWVKR